MRKEDMTKEQKLFKALENALEIIDSKNKLIEGLTRIAEQAVKELEVAERKLKKLQETN